MKLRFLFSVIISFVAVFSLAAQNDDAFEAFKQAQTRQFETYKQDREAEYRKFKEQYYSAFEKFKNAYTRYLNGELDVVDLMASDDGVKITPLTADVPTPKIVSYVKDEKSRIKRDMDNVRKLNPEDVVSMLSSAKDTVDQMQEAAEKMEEIVENMAMSTEAEEQAVQVEPVKPTEVVLEAVDEEFLAGLIKEQEQGQKQEQSKTDTQQRDTYTSSDETAEAGVPHGKPTNYNRISSPFGTRVHPITRKTHTHKGVDMAAPRMTPIYATADGEVTYAQYNGGYGNFVKVNHRNGYKTAYAHMHQIAVNKGQSVKKGDLIGYVGTTGRSTGNHLHYEVYYQDGLVDPETTL